MAKDTNETRKDRAARRKAHQDANLFSRVAAAGSTSRTHAQKCLKNSVGLSIVEWRVLWDLSEAEPLSVRDIATIQRFDHSLISRALPRMQSKGYVTLTKDETDKRQILVTMTEAGREAFERASPDMKERRAKLRAAFTPKETEQFLSYIERFEACLEIPSDEALDKVETA